MIVPCGLNVGTVGAVGADIEPPPPPPAPALDTLPPPPSNFCFCITATRARPEASAIPAAIAPLTGEVTSAIGLNCDLYADCADSTVSIVACAMLTALLIANTLRADALLFP